MTRFAGHQSQAVSRGIYGEKAAHQHDVEEGHINEMWMFLKLDTIYLDECGKAFDGALST